MIVIRIHQIINIVQIVSFKINYSTIGLQTIRDVFSWQKIFFLLKIAFFFFKKCNNYIKGCLLPNTHIGAKNNVSTHTRNINKMGIYYD